MRNYQKTFEYIIIVYINNKYNEIHNLNTFHSWSCLNADPQVKLKLFQDKFHGFSIQHSKKLNRDAAGVYNITKQ